VASAVGIDAATIRRIAIDFAKAKSAVAYGRVGICHGPFGPLASWLIDAINIVTGNFDRPGGAMFANPAADLTVVSRRLGLSGSGRYRSRVRGLPETGGMLPAAAMAEEMETPGKGQIRALFTLAGNPVLSVPSGERLARSLAGLDFMASIDIYINETTRHAHIILPPCFAFERGHYDLLLHAVAVQNTAKWSEPIFPRGPDERDDWDILLDLARRLEQKLPSRLRVELARRMGLERTLDLLLRVGPHGDRFLPFRDGLNLDKLRRAVHGIDLGPLVPMRKRRVFMPNGLVELAPAPLVADVARVETWLEAPQNGSLVLIGRRHMRSNNSWMHNAQSLVKGPDRSGLLMNPDDARRLSLSDAAMVRVTSRTGSVAVRLVVTGDIRQGVVSLPHGFGHADAADTLRIAGALPGANANAITDDALVEPLTATAILSGVPVTVEPLGPHAPALA
jgi:anaerobic selenocysteine-containing dehydrogenase